MPIWIRHGPTRRDPYEPGKKKSRSGRESLFGKTAAGGKNMPYGEDGCKTYFSSLGTVIFLFCLFVAGSIFGITVDSMK